MAADEVRDELLTSQRFSILLLWLFASVALVLASVGIYSVLSYVIRGRKREIGIRSALGAQRTDVLRLVVMEGMTPALIGIAAGTVAKLRLKPSSCRRSCGGESSLLVARPLSRPRLRQIQRAKSRTCFNWHESALWRCLAALALSRFLERLMFEVSPSDPLTLAVVASTLIIVALTASVVPAYRASRLDPLTVLRDN